MCAPAWGGRGQRTNTRIFQQGCFPNSPTPLPASFRKKRGLPPGGFFLLLWFGASRARGLRCGSPKWLRPFARFSVPGLSKEMAAIPRLQNLPGGTDFVSPSSPTLPSLLDSVARRNRTALPSKATLSPKRPSAQPVRPSFHALRFEGEGEGSLRLFSVLARL